MKLLNLVKETMNPTASNKSATNPTPKIRHPRLLQPLQIPLAPLLLAAALLLVTGSAQAYPWLTLAQQTDSYATIDKDWLSQADYDLDYNGLGTAGWVFFGNFDGVAESGQPFSHRVQSLPGYITWIAPGADFDSVSDELNTVAPGYGVIDNPVTHDGSDARSGVAMATGGTAGSKLSVIEFNVNYSLPYPLRVGILAGTEESADGRWDPTSITLSSAFYNESKTVGNHAANPLPILPNATTPSSAGWVFFDIRIPATYTISATRRLDVGGVAIAGLTFDAPTAVSTQGPYVVTNDADFGVGSLRWAIYQADHHPNSTADPTDTIVFDPVFFSTPRTIKLADGELLTGSGSGKTIIIGPGADLLTIDGNNRSRVFFIRGGTSVEISGLTVANGWAFEGLDTKGTGSQGGGINNQGRLTLTGVTLRNNRCELESLDPVTRGGAIHNSGNLTINDCLIEQNTALSITSGEQGTQAYGGGIYNLGTLVVNNTTIRDNLARAVRNGEAANMVTKAYGGGVFSGGAEASATFDHCTISDNIAVSYTPTSNPGISAFGGGISAGGTLIVRNGCVISGNTARADMGWTFFASADSASVWGGGIHLSEGTATVTDSVIDGNHATTNGKNPWCQVIGGGAAVESGSLMLRESTISNNSAEAVGLGKAYALGGGLYAPTAVINCAVTGNQTFVSGPVPVVTSLGGGVYAVGPANLFNVTVAGNSCRGDGNVVAVYGGGLYVDSNTTLLRGVSVVANSCSTTAANFAAWGGGIYLNTGSTGPGFADLGNTIVAGNTVQSGGAAPYSPDINGTITSQGHNLIGDPAGGSGFAGSDLTTVSALDVFLDIDSNGTIDANDLATGGAASGTFPLRLGSLARNAGDNALIPIDPDTALPLATDQRGTGHPRIVGGTVDIGAYEGFLVTDPNLHVFEGFVNDDFFELANWNSAGTPTPADMAAGDTYLILAPAVLHGAAVLGGELKIDALGSLTVDSAGSLDLNASSLVSGDGTLAVKGLLRTTGNGTASISAPLILNNTGSPGRVLEIPSGSELQNTGAVYFQAGEAMVRGTWGHNQLQLEVLADAVLRGDGWLKGGDVGVYGRVEPGPDTGHGDLHIQGSFTHYDTATTRIKVGGIGADEFDRIVLTGQAALGGTLLADFTERGFAVGGTYQFLVSPHSTLYTYLSRIPVGLASGYTFDYSRDTPGQFTVTAPAPQTFTFTGLVDSDFLNPANWSGDLSGLASPASPRPEDAYVVASDASLSGDADVNGSLTVNTGVKLTIAEGGSLTMNNGANLVVAGRLEGNAALSFPSAAALTLSGGEVASAVTATGPVTVTADSTISGSFVLDSATLNVKAGATLHVGAGFSLTLQGTAVATIESGGTLSNEGLVQLKASGPISSPTTLRTVDSGRFVNELTGVLNRSGTDYSKLEGTFVNDGHIGESVSTEKSLWSIATIENHATGDVLLRGGFFGNLSLSNDGTMTADSSYITIHPSTIFIRNGGTLNLLHGTYSLIPVTIINDHGGVINGKIFLGGLDNHGTVNLTGNTTFSQYSPSSPPFINRTDGVIEQGPYNVNFKEQGTYTNEGIWKSSGQIKLGDEQVLVIGAGGVLNNNGSWLIDPAALGGPGLEVAGLLTGSAPLNVPANGVLMLSGGEVASAVTSAGPVSVTADSTISGALTLQGANVTGTALLTIAPTGRLGGVGSIAGPVVVDGSITPAAGSRVLGAGLTTLNGLLNSEINGATVDQFAVKGDLVLGGQAGLQVGALIPPTEPRYLLASYTGNLVGTFGTVTVPAEYELDTSVPHEVAIRLKNQPPVADASSVSTDEDTVLNGTLTATDADNDALTYVKVSDPAHGSVNVNPDGTFTYTPNADYNGPDSFTFKASDGTDDSEPATISITVNPVNDAPSFAVGVSVVVSEDSGAYTASQATGINDGDPEVTQALHFNVSNNNNSLFSVQPDIAPDGMLAFTPAPNASGPAEVTVSLTDDDTAGGAALTTASQTFFIQVNPVNDMPVFAVGGDVNVDEDSGAYSAAQATGIDDGDPEIAQGLTFNVSNDHNSLFSVQPAMAANGTLSFTPAENAVGSALVTVTLTDDGQLPLIITGFGGQTGSEVMQGGTFVLSEPPPDSQTFTVIAPPTTGETMIIPPTTTGLTTAAQTFTITVKAVNDLPVFLVGNDVTVNEDSGSYSAPQATGIDDGDPEVTQTLTFNVSNNNASLFSVQPAITANGTLSFTPAPNSNGVALVTVSLTDDATAGGDALTTAEQTFSITVNAVNDPPVITLSTASQTVAYSDWINEVSVSLKITVKDVDSSSASLKQTGAPAGLALSSTPDCVSDGAGGCTCTWTLSGQVTAPAGDYDITFTANDGTTDSSSKTYQLTVVPEGAVVYFDERNPVAQPVSKPGGNSGPFTLTFYVVEQLPDQPNDGSQDYGDLSKIITDDVKASLVPVGQGGSVVGTCKIIGVHEAGYDQHLEVECTFENVPVNTYVLQVDVTGSYFNGFGDDTLVVYDASLGFTTGGGWFYWPDTEKTDEAGNVYRGDRTTLGYTMKYNKQGTKVQGSLLMIRHLPDGTIHRIKSNALYGLAVSSSKDPYGWASFAGKSTYQAPEWAEPEGNYEFTVYVEDNREPNEPDAPKDRIWIEVRDKDGQVVEGLSLPCDANDSSAVYPEELEAGNIVAPRKAP